MILLIAACAHDPVPPPEASTIPEVAPVPAVIPEVAPRYTRALTDAIRGARSSGRSRPKTPRSPKK